MNSTVNTKLVVTYDASVAVDERELNEAVAYSLTMRTSGQEPSRGRLMTPVMVNDEAREYTVHDIAIGLDRGLIIVLRDEGSTQEDAWLIYGETNPNRFLVVEERTDGYRPKQMVYVTRHDAALSA